MCTLFFVNFLMSKMGDISSSQASLQSVHPHPPPPSAGGGGVEPPTKFSKRAGLTGPQLLEGGYWERGGDFFQGEVAIFT